MVRAFYPGAVGKPNQDAPCTDQSATGLPGLPPHKKHENHKKSYMAFYENVKIIESAIEVYGNMQIIKDQKL